jgi:hypothetical protein
MIKRNSMRKMEKPKEHKRTRQEMIDRATDPDWMGISDDVLKKMIAKGLIKDQLPPDMAKRLGVST